MPSIQKILQQESKDKESKDFLPILLIISIASGCLLIVASYLAKL